MAKYRTKPFEIEAVQFKGDANVIKAVFPDVAFKKSYEVGGYIDLIKVWNEPQQTWVTVNILDYVIKDAKGGYYPCEPSVFEAKYECAKCNGTGFMTVYKRWDKLYPESAMEVCDACRKRKDGNA